MDHKNTNQGSKMAFSHKDLLTASIDRKNKEKAEAISSIQNRLVRFAEEFSQEVESRRKIKGDDINLLICNIVSNLQMEARKISLAEQAIISNYEQIVSEIAD